MEGTHGLLLFGTHGTVLGGLIPFVVVYLLFFLCQRDNRYFNYKGGIQIDTIFLSLSITRRSIATTMLNCFQVVHCGCSYTTFNVRFLGRCRSLRQDTYVRIANYLIHGSSYQVVSRHANSNCALRLSTKRLVKFIFRPFTRSCNLRHLGNTPPPFKDTSSQVVRRQRFCVFRDDHL